MQRAFRVLLIVGTIASLAACEKGEKAGRQKAAVEARKTAIEKEIDGVLDGWLKEMVAKLPADVKKYPKAKSPLVHWRLDSFGYDWRRPIGAAVVKAKGTPFEKHFADIPEFFDAMEQFWAKKIDFKDYMAAWDKLKQGGKSRLVNLLADFDHTFVHVEAFYGAQDMEGDDRAIYFFRHWQVAFHFPREFNEAVSQYLARLCKAKLKDFCSTVPFEKLHFAMERPYLTEVKRIVNEFLKTYPDCELNRIFEPFLAEVDARLAALKDIREDPVMPSSVSRKDYVGDVILTVRRTGVEYEDRLVLPLPKEDAKDGGWPFPDDPAWRSGAAAVKKLSDSLEEERGPENMEVIRIDMDRQAPAEILVWVAQTWRELPARFLTFGARRRLDGIDKGTVTGRIQIREIPGGPPRRLMLEGVGTITCNLIGQTTDSRDLPSKVRNVVWLDDRSLLAGELAGKVVKGTRPVEPTEAARHLLATESLFLVESGTPYERLLSVVDPLFLACKDPPACLVVEDLAPRVEMRVCEDDKRRGD